MSDPELGLAALRRQARLLMILDGAARAGLVPLGVLPLHAFAYMSNVLAPVWDLPALDGKILKRKGGPFYPTLQRDVDRLVGMGMVSAESIDHVRDASGKWRLEAYYSVGRLAGPAMTFLREEAGLQELQGFVDELAYAISALGDFGLEIALVEDATYSDPAVSQSNVIDFGEWAQRNPSANAANYFDQVMPGGTHASPGEKLHLYVRHLRRRALDR